MQYYCLNSSSVKISRFVFGCAALGGSDHGYFDKAALSRAINTAIDNGINAFDTADCYGLGLSESNLSEILGDKRHELIIATKFGVRWKEPRNGERAETFKDISPEWAVQALENSLRRLRVDCIPIYFIHWPDGVTSISATMEALERCRLQGKIQHIGVSNFSLAQLKEAETVAPVAVLECQYSLIRREVETSLFAYTRERGIATWCYGTLAQGLLSGKYRSCASFDSSDHRSRLPHFGEGLLNYEVLLEALDHYAGAYNAHPSQVAISWALKNPSCGSILFGAKTGEQVLSNIKALEVNLDNATVERLNAISQSLIPEHGGGK